MDGHSKVNASPTGSARHAFDSRSKSSNTRGRAASIRAISALFDMRADFIHAHPHGSGHINDTYCATFDQAGQRVLVVKQGREFPFQQVTDLRDKLIGASIGASYGNVFDAAVADGTLTIVGFNDTRNGLAMLMRERIDAILLGSSVDLPRLVRDNPDLQGATFATLPVAFKTDSKYLGISVTLKMGWFLQQFNQCLERGYNSGVFDSIIYQYSN